MPADPLPVVFRPRIEDLCLGQPRPSAVHQPAMLVYQSQGQQELTRWHPDGNPAMPLRHGSTVTGREIAS
jgi:hypothetical protein